MTKSDSVQAGKATHTNIREILGDVDDEIALAILALHPTIGQLEEARIWISGEGDVLGKMQRPLDGVVAQIYDLFPGDDEEPPVRH